MLVNSKYMSIVAHIKGKDIILADFVTFLNKIVILLYNT